MTPETRLGPGFEPGSGSSMNLRRFESPGNAARIAVLSAGQALTAIIGCPNMTTPDNVAHKQRLRQSVPL